ncbi:hypothetical protein [Halopelagius inordinatus]|nr:hypothetical protein [Halopelagius inordinatus]
MELGPDSVGVGRFGSEQGRIDDSATGEARGVLRPPRRRRAATSGVGTR